MNINTGQIKYLTPKDLEGKEKENWIEVPSEITAEVEKLLKERQSKNETLNISDLNSKLRKIANHSLKMAKQDKWARKNKKIKKARKLANQKRNQNRKKT